MLHTSVLSSFRCSLFSVEMIGGIQTELNLGEYSESHILSIAIMRRECGRPGIL